MKIWWDNQIDADGVIATATSEVSDLPVENVIDDFRRRVFRSNSTPTNFYITFDLGVVRTIDSCILLDHTIDPDAYILLEGSTNNFATTAFSEELDWAEDTILGVLSVNQSLRYWRISIELLTTLPIFEIGRIFLGQVYATEDEPEWEDYTETVTDPSRVQKSISGQTWVEALDNYRTLDLTFKAVPDTLGESMVDLYREVGLVKSFFVMIDDDMSPLNNLYYVRFGKQFQRKVAAYTDSSVEGGEFRWNFQLQLEEQL